MRISLWRYAAAGVLILGVASSYGCGKRSVASVNGEKITQDAFYKRLQRSPVAPQVTFPPALTQQQAVSVLDSMITEELLLELAEKEKVTPTEEQLEERKKELNGALNDRSQDLAAMLQRAGMTVKDLEERLKPELAQTNLIAKYVKIPDEEVKKTYDQATTGLPNDQRHRSAFYLPASAKLYGILNPDKEKIMAAKKQLDNGVAFGVVAEQYSDDEQTKRNRGEIGWVNKPDEVRPAPPGVPAEVYDKAFTTPKGKITEPFQASGQWMILRVEDRKEARMQPFDHVKGVIRDRMLRQRAAENEQIVKLLGPVVNTQMGPQLSLANLRKDAKVDVTLPAYKPVFENYQEQLKKLPQPSVTERATGAGGDQPAAPGGGE